MGYLFRLYGHYLSISLRSQLQYRVSFTLLLLGQFLMTGLEFLGVVILLNRFQNLQGWYLPEIALFYSIINIAFSLCDAIAQGLGKFPSLLKTGEFDRLLLRPHSALLQLTIQELTLRRFGRLIQGLMVLLWAGSQLHLVWSVPKLLLLGLTILGGASVFYGLMILQATFSFWTIESLEIMNTVTYGGVETAQYPLTIYQPWFRRFFTFIVPLGCVSYYPVVAMLDHLDPLGSRLIFQYLSPSIGFLFLWICLKVWGFGLRNYCSSGS
jgi:ABC-2 type transport system permease protein